MKIYEKKILVILLVAVLLLFSVAMVKVNAANEVVEADGTGQLIEMKEKEKKSIEDYTEAYGSETYGFTAYLLNIIRLYSIPLCFLGIAVGAIWQYVIGIRKLDVRDRGFHVIIAFVTILIIAQVLPLVFAIVVKGWRG